MYGYNRKIFYYLFKNQKVCHVAYDLKGPEFFPKLFNFFLKMENIMLFEIKIITVKLKVIENKTFPNVWSRLSLILRQERMTQRCCCCCCCCCRCFGVVLGSLSSFSLSCTHTHTRAHTFFSIVFEPHTGERNNGHR